MLAASVAIGLAVLDGLEAAQVTELADPRGQARPRAARPEDGSVPLGGRAVDVRRPRVRTADDTTEATLATGSSGSPSA